MRKSFKKSNLNDQKQTYTAVTRLNKQTKKDCNIGIIFGKGNDLILVKKKKNTKKQKFYTPVQTKARK